MKGEPLRGFVRELFMFSIDGKPLRGYSEHLRRSGFLPIDTV
jgi:hypothetical protein